MQAVSNNAATYLSTADDSDSDEDEAAGRLYPEQLWLPRSADPVETAGSLTAHGVVGLRDLLSAASISAMCSFLDQELVDRKLQATAVTGSPEEPAALAAFSRYFGDIREQRHRYDMKLSIDDTPVRRAIHAICTALCPLLEAVMTLDARVVELSSLISDPGAKPQLYHTDSLLPSRCGAPLYTCFVALQDIDHSMGPTQLIPCTHNLDSHVRLREKTEEGKRDREMADAASFHMGCRAGDAFVMDSRLWHRGGANNSGSRRRLLCAHICGINA